MRMSKMAHTDDDIKKRLNKSRKPLLFWAPLRAPLSCKCKFLFLSTFSLPFFSCELRVVVEVEEDGEGM
jgi:hypothetical protein